ncbi:MULTISPECIES: pseudaminic acid cytidylyltransferase [Rhizobium/Agrobacterium group]|uniref:pseudaminic acid cytidylyltransferase n=1 Tax=Rhizobium oryzihabitans TaxID=2267833 RepID=UPI00403341C9
MRLAVIPARGGSKRIPRKNVKLFEGRPMIAYAIAAAHGCGLFDRIVVSTDDDEIAAVALREGAEVPFTRPPELADDHTPTVPVIAQAIRALDAMGFNATEVCCIYPGVPMLSRDDLIRAHDLLSATGRGYAFPVAAFPSPIQRALRMDGQHAVSPFQPENTGVRTQDLEPAYFDAGQFYWGMRDAWLDGLAVHPNGCAIVLPEWRVVDIDTTDDWERAEILYRALLGSVDR